MLPFFPYQGGKRKEIKILKNYFPEYTTMVDVFGGGGSVLLSELTLNTNIIYHYNDKDPAVSGVYNKLYKIDEDFITEMQNLYVNEDNIQKFKDNKLDFSNENIFLFLSKTKFRGIIKSECFCYGKRAIYNGKSMYDIYNPLLYIDKLTKYKIKITSEDYTILFKQYKNNKKAFLYLDPPYVSRKTDEYNFTFTIDDIENIFNFMKEAKCKVLLNIDYVGYTREKFKDFFKFGYPVKYDSESNLKKYNIYSKYHMICTNY